MYIVIFFSTVSEGEVARARMNNISMHRNHFVFVFLKGVYVLSHLFCFLGGFLAKVTVEGMDFDSSCFSELLSTPEEATDSAAALMIAQLRAMAGHT